MNIFTTSQENRFNEILFENRNKAYGAYQLRASESAILRKSLFLGIAVFAGISLTPVFINALDTAEVPSISDNSGHTLVPVDEIEPPAASQTPVVSIPPATVSIEMPTPTKNPVKDVAPPTVNDIRDAHIGLVTVSGPPPVSSYTPPVTLPQVPVAPPQSVPKPIDDSPVAKVDVEAKFSGGIDAFRSRVVQNFSTDDFEGRGEVLKTMVTFIVEKDGNISAVKATGKDPVFNAEAEKTIKKIKGKWTPAQFNGQSVRSYFKFPISMQFE